MTNNMLKAWSPLTPFTVATTVEYTIPDTEFGIWFKQTYGRDFDDATDQYLDYVAKFNARLETANPYPAISDR